MVYCLYYIYVYNLRVKSSVEKITLSYRFMVSLSCYTKERYLPWKELFRVWVYHTFHWFTIRLWWILLKLFYATLNPVSIPYTKVCKTYRMYFSGTETADWSILLPFLVKTYAKARLLPEGRGAKAIGTDGRRARPPESIRSSPRHWNTYGIVLYSNGDIAEYYDSLCRKGKFQPAPLSEDTFQRKGVRSSCYALSEEIFFRLLEKQPELRITQIIQEQQDESGTYWVSWVS